jgi:ATP-dependent exoDNAse (exonuclease V) beta subunit
LPEGLSDTQRVHLATASEAIDAITCSTIHGFCQRLIKPYPVEADIDPGAAVMDRIRPTSLSLRSSRLGCGSGFLEPRTA